MQDTSVTHGTTFIFTTAVGNFRKAVIGKSTIIKKVEKSHWAIKLEAIMLLSVKDIAVINADSQGNLLCA